MPKSIEQLARKYALPITILLVVLLFSALGGWYFYLNGRQAVIATIDAGRGLGDTLVSGFPVGSTYSNITNAIGNAFGIGTTTTQVGAPSPQLWRVTSAPTTGLQWTESNGRVVLRFVDRASGNVFDADPAQTTVERKTNTLIPKVVEAFWVGEETLILRQDGVSGVETLSATIRPATTTSESVTQEGPGVLEANTLPRGITAITSAPDGRLFYLTLFNGAVAGIIARLDGSSPQRIWTHPIINWRARQSSNQITLIQPASGGIEGSAYRLSLSGTLSPLIAGVRGLSINEHPANDSFLYNSSPERGVPQTFVRRNGVDTPLPFATFAEKCVWDPTADARLYCAVPRSFPQGARLPDFWYRGEVRFSDAIWMFDLANGTVEQVFDPASSSQALDILDPVISPDGAYLAFLDAPTGSGWVLRLK